MNIGKEIKKLRNARGLSQSELAEAFNVTPQAISKWESTASYPDIGMLPVIASYFGITIDELFEYPNDLEYMRIEQVIKNGEMISNEFFCHSEEFLTSELKKNPNNYRANSLLGDLYHFEAGRLNEKASYYAVKALEIKPDNKSDLNTLNNALNGVIYDWNIANHSKLIEIYQRLIHNSSVNHRTCLYLMDNLIDEGRLTEAEEFLDHNEIEMNSFYRILIQEKRNGFKNTDPLYQKLVEENRENWKILMDTANRYAFNHEYQQAIELYETCFEKSPKPRHADILEAIALLQKHMGDFNSARNTYKRELNLFKEEWNITKGEMIKEVQKNIEECGKGI